MNVFPVLSGLLPLAVLALVVWLAMRATGRAPSDDVIDPATVIKRVFLYGLLYITLLVAAQGLIELADQLLASSDERSNAALARSLAFLVVGSPAVAALGWYVDRRLRDRPEERRSAGWTVYLIAALVTALLGAMISAHGVLLAALAPSEDRSFDGQQLVAGLIWGGLWAAHWFYFKARYGLRGNVHLSLGTLIGLAPLAIGSGGMIWVAADEIYTAIADDPLSDRTGPTLGAWTATAVVGGVTWGWHWLANYRRAERSQLWYITVVPIGALAGFVATVVGSATAANTVAVWYLGEPTATEAVRHFDSLPGLAAVIIVGVVSWSYHRSLLDPDSDRNLAIRAYDYLLAAAALVAAVVGVVLLLVSLFAVGESSSANTVIAGVTLVLVGGPIWVRFWTAIGRHVAADRLPELRSPLRRIYLFSLFGVGGLVVLIGVLAVLTNVIEAVLDGTVSRDTLHDNRVGLAVVLTVTGVAWYHFGIYRSERPDYGPAPPPPPTRPPQRVIVVAGHDDDVANELAEMTGASVTLWHRTDCTEVPTIDIERLGRLVTAQSAQDLLVLVGGDEPRVIPFVTTGHDAGGA